MDTELYRAAESIAICNHVNNSNVLNRRFPTKKTFGKQDVISVYVANVLSINVHIEPFSNVLSALGYSPRSSSLG